LLKYLEEFGKYAGITGFRKAKIGNPEEFLQTVRRNKPPDVEIQFFDSTLIATWEHLYFAVFNALKAFRDKENISKNLAIETMLYASAQHQIRKATSMLGIHPGMSNMAVLVVGEEPKAIKSTLTMISEQVNAHPDDTILELSQEKIRLIKKTYGISDVELETVAKKDNSKKALVNAVIEQMALLATKR
jgi:tRNA threonylcarbamoyladenosine modification (KEOPS) complex Cgi121 subunit